MKFTSIVVVVVAASALPESVVVAARDDRVAPLPLSSATEAWKRASAQAPNGYAPAVVDCPSTRPSIRAADGLSQAERQWLQKRRPRTVEALREFLVRANMTGFDAGQYVDRLASSGSTSGLPNIALAFSGGGYRALLNGAGALAAFDNRTTNATTGGQLGGLLQAATYISALSGGGWMVGSVYANNFSAVQDLAASSDVWQFQNSLFKGPPSTGLQLLSTADYFANLVDTVSDKVNSPAGDFNASITDYYGRALSFQLINATHGAPAYTFSSIQDDVDFDSGNAPMPILVADERAPGDIIVSLNATVFEFNPFEFGTWDNTIYGFSPLKYIGSNFSAGELPPSQGCVAGFDNLGFVMGTSSSLFNQAFITAASSSSSSSSESTILNSALTAVLGAIGQDANDIADYTPNPFLGYHNDTNRSAGSQRLTLVDGGEDLQNIPLNPVIQPMRQVDVIFAIDSSADMVEEDDPAKNWPNGTSLVATYQRANTHIMNGTSFPYIPGQDTFVALGLNNRPTFFGCNSSNVTEGDNIPPLIVYLPNAPYVFLSNTSTLGKLDYTLDERNSMIQNGYDVATQGNSTREGASNWPACVGCAILSRSLERNGESIPDVCQQCFAQYCWNGTVVETSAPYMPEMILAAVKPAANGGLGRFVPNAFAMTLAVVVSGYLAI